MESFEPRDRQPPKASAPQAAKNSSQSNEVTQAAKAIDQGPTFGTPGDPPDADRESVDEIENAYEGSDRKGDVSRSG